MQVRGKKRTVLSTALIKLSKDILYFMKKLLKYQFFCVLSSLFERFFAFPPPPSNTHLILI